MANPCAGGVPLTILAGTPDIWREAVLDALKKHFRSKDGNALRYFEYISGKNGAEYCRHNITQCLKVLASRIRSKRGKNEISSNPNHISVVYLESFQKEKNDLLLRSFFSFAHCVKIPKRDKMWNLCSSKEIIEEFITAIRPMRPWKDIQGLKYTYLPLRHFMCQNEKSLWSACLERVNEYPHQPPIIKKLIPQPNCQRKKCRTCPHPTEQRVPRDQRGLCFVSSAPDGSPYGNEGLWEKVEQSQSTPDGSPYSLIFMNSFYRFGLPVLPGTHFDVQYPGEKKIKPHFFQCPQHGGMPAQSCDYVNVYPNDTVR